MIVECPSCQARLRYKHSEAVKALRCPRCQTKFKIGQSANTFIALVAHEDQDVRDLLAERLAKADCSLEFCESTDGIVEHFQADQCCVLLIDVAFQGSFPFQLIEEIKAVSSDQHKTILLPSVYNRTAYKKRPESLYGADAYLELHHIGDRLLPLLSELLPALTARTATVSPVLTSGGERQLKEENLPLHAESLARLLVADILLYHQQDLERGLEKGKEESLFARHLAEGRKLLSQRLPAVENHPDDFILQAFRRACQSYRKRY